MNYRTLGKTDLQLSIIGLGGHEFHPDGRVKGFQDDFKLAVTAGHVFEGFGQKQRIDLVKKALDSGINVFDLTIDSEKEALGRTLAALSPSEEIFIQTRPEGMGYSYDPENRKMASYELLSAEVQRILKMTGRDRIDILNLPFIQSALDTDREYIEKMGANIAQLKKEGHIGFAGCDTLGGRRCSLAAIESGYFDVVYTNYNIIEPHMRETIIRAARAKNMGVIVREAFIKGRLFAMAEDVGIADAEKVAHASLKWILYNTDICTLMAGVSNAEQLESNVRASEDLMLTSEERGMLDRIGGSTKFKEEFEGKSKQFFEK